MMVKKESEKGERLIPSNRDICKNILLQMVLILAVGSILYLFGYSLGLCGRPSYDENSSAVALSNWLGVASILSISVLSAIGIMKKIMGWKRACLASVCLIFLCFLSSGYFVLLSKMANYYHSWYVDLNISYMTWVHCSILIGIVIEILFAKVKCVSKKWIFCISLFLLIFMLGGFLTYKTECKEHVVVGEAMVIDEQYGFRDELIYGTVCRIHMYGLKIAAYEPKKELK